MLAAAGLAGASDLPSQAPPRSIRDITALLDQYKPDPSKAAEVRKILDQAPPDTQDRKDLARYYKQKAIAAADIGAGMEYLTHMRTVIDLGGEKDIGEDRALLADAEIVSGNFSQAVGTLQYVLDQFPLYGYNVKKARVSGELAYLYGRLGELDVANKYILRAEGYSAAYGLQSNAANYKNAPD